MQTNKSPIIKAAPIECGIGTLYASMDDLAGGEKINKGSITMGSNAGTIKTRGVVVSIIHDVGASLTLECNGRKFRLNLEAFLEEGIKAGLLNPEKMDFPRDI